MVKRKFWLRLLNVDQGEWWMVRNLMMLQFLQGAGIAFFFTGAFATFLNEFPITELPWVMILSAALLWVVGYLYSKIEHKLPMNQLTIVVTAVMVISIIFFRLADYNFPEGVFLYWTLAWFHVLYLLNNLQFWGMATLLFDLRQSKRLFGLISSGDIPAKFFGYTLATLAIKYIGTMNMLYAAAACMALSFPFLLAIHKSGKLLLQHNHKEHEVEHVQHQSTFKTGTLIRNFANNKFIRDIALISMLAFCCLLIVDYGFYSEVKHRTHDDQDLGTFIAAFMAIARLFAMFVKMIFTGRVMSNMGVRQTLLITPLVMLGLTGLIVASQLIDSPEKVLFYLFGVTFILVDVCRTVFNSPSLITLMQPLPTHERLRAHNIVKGIMDPFAYIVTGILLLVLIRFQHEVPLQTLSYILVIMGAIWLLGIYLVNKQYLLILVKTITSRYFSQEEFSLKDENILQAIRKKIATGNDLEVISILKMLNSKTDPVANELAASLINHPSSQVKLETLKIISGKLGDEVRSAIEALAQNDLLPEIRDEAIRALCKTSSMDDNMRTYVEHENQALQKAALSGMLMNPDPYVRELSEEKISTLIRSKNRMDKFFAAVILQDIRNDYSHPLLHNLIADPDPQVQAIAIKAIGKVADRDSLHALINILPQHVKPALQALQLAGENAVELIGNMLQSGQHKQWEEKFIAILGRQGGEKAQSSLVSMLLQRPEHTQLVIKALYRTKYKADESMMKHMESLSRQFIIYGVELLHMQKVIAENDGHKILKSSLNLEVQEIRDLLLCLFACMFDRVKMNQAKHGLESNLNENVANSMEIIELTIKKDIGRNFNTMFECTSLEHRCDALRALLKEIDFAEVDDVIAKVLKEKPIHYLDWTKACSLYITKKYLHNIDMALIEKYSHAENRMVRETAQFALVNA
jgi:ATP:ADP antiporter, AAA family